MLRCSRGRHPPLEVAGSGTIYFREVACATAFRIVFKQFGLAGNVEPNIVTVEPRRN